MQVSVTYEVKGCRGCPYSSNNAQEHDDPFSSSPANIVWYCNYNRDSRERVHIDDGWKMIPENCPVKKQNVQPAVPADKADALRVSGLSK